MVRDLHPFSSKISDRNRIVRFRFSSLEGKVKKVVVLTGLLLGLAASGQVTASVPMAEYTKGPVVSPLPPGCYGTGTPYPMKFDYEIHLLTPGLFNGSGARELIFGSDGNDVINGWGGNDCVYSGEGDDVINGGSGNDHMFGEGGIDRIDGSSGSQDECDAESETGCEF